MLPLEDMERFVRQSWPDMDFDNAVTDARIWAGRRFALKINGKPATYAGFHPGWYAVELKPGDDVPQTTASKRPVIRWFAFSDEVLARNWVSL